MAVRVLDGPPREVYDEYEPLCSYSSYFFLQKQDLMRVFRIIFIKCKLDKKLKTLEMKKRNIKFILYEPCNSILLFYINPLFKPKLAFISVRCLVL